MIPLRDINPHSRTPVITYLLIAANFLVWWKLQGAGFGPQLESSICQWGFVPWALVGAAHTHGWTGQLCPAPPQAPWAALFLSMFMHGGWIHILGNMWFLHVFGNNIEDRMGHLKFFFFYIFSGLAAALAQAFLDPQSTLPMVGASGAISGVMGAYLVTYPRVRIETFVFFGFFMRVILIPAWFMLIYWLFLQVLGGVFTNEVGGVAYGAHIGGFIAGVVFAKLGL